MSTSSEKIVLNLGCGNKISGKCVNIDWAVHLRLARNPILRALAWPFLSAPRRKYIEGLSREVIVHNLRNGIPYDSNTVDAVYHSHVLEHIDRDQVLAFQSEVYRVLKPGGVQRICVPNLSLLARQYLDSFDRHYAKGEHPQDHDSLVAEILEQCVRREAWGTSQQSRVRRLLENLFLGDARSRGETHQWMYDFVNIGAILKEAGFEAVKEFSYNQSQIDNWESFGLEVNSMKQEYKPQSLYVEAMKPLLNKV